jgi:hypothetical protein
VVIGASVTEPLSDLLLSIALFIENPKCGWIGIKIIIIYFLTIEGLSYAF